MVRFARLSWTEAGPLSIDDGSPHWPEPDLSLSDLPASRSSRRESPQSSRKRKTSPIDRSAPSNGKRSDRKERVA